MKTSSTNITTHNVCRGKKQGKKGYGPTSFWLQDPETIFSHLPLREGMVFVDAGCGAGEYSLHAAHLLGKAGHVIALDSVESSVEHLTAMPRENGMAELTAHVCDITSRLPLQDHSADIVMLSTVLHIRSVRDRAKSMFSEFRRILKPNGMLAILECKKEEASFGPPLHSRLSVDEVTTLAVPHGFILHSELALKHTYMACFRLQ